MAIDFPASPTIGQTFTSGGMVYVFNGTGWTVKGGTTLDWVLKAGDTMSGDLTISKTKPNVILDRPVGSPAEIFSKTGGLTRWRINLANGLAESGGNVGSGFQIDRYDDAGNIIEAALKIDRATGYVTIGQTTIANAYGNLIIQAGAGTGSPLIQGMKGGLVRWELFLGDSTAETGSDAGSNFSIRSDTDAGVAKATPLTISRATGATALSSTVASTSPSTGALTVAGGLGVAGNIHSSAIGLGTAIGTYPGVGNTTVGTEIGTGYFTVSIASGNAPIFSNRNVDGGLMDCRRSGVSTGNISTTATACSFNTSSDANLKEDLKSFDAGNIIDDTEVYDFKWKATGERAYGVLGQQAKEVYATPVTYDEKEDRHYVDYSKYVPVLLQELKAVRARLAVLEGRTPDKPPAKKR
jgi:Chaperone of endosialidase